jgi:hypothetical protein
VNHTGDAVVRQALRDPAAAPPACADSQMAAAWVASARRHRVLPLLGWHLQHAGTIGAWPARFVDAGAAESRRAVVADWMRERELVELLAQLAAAGVHALVMKGGALAYLHYPEPHLRPRADTDLLIAASDVPALDAVVARAGYRRPIETSGRLVSYQSHYVKQDAHGFAHGLDVHWKISNVQALADRLAHAELWANRVPVPALGPAAAAPDGVSALALALVHRAGHHPGSQDLLWMYDLCLLARALTDAECDRAIELLRDRGLASIAVEGLATASRCFGEPAVDALLRRAQAIERGPDDVAVIPSTSTPAGLLRRDLTALPTWRARARLLREHVLPPTQYMAARYGVRARAALPVLYVWRALHGLPKWLMSNRD